MTNRNDSVTIGTDTLEVSPPSLTGGERQVITFTNTSTGGQVISISIGEQAVAGKGIVLSPGGFYSEAKDNSFEVTQEKINAISSLAGGVLAIHERRL